MAFFTSTPSTLMPVWIAHNIARSYPKPNTFFCPIHLFCHLLYSFMCMIPPARTWLVLGTLRKAFGFLFVSFHPTACCVSFFHSCSSTNLTIAALRAYFHFLLPAPSFVSRFIPLRLSPSFYLFLPGVHKHPHCHPPIPIPSTASQRSILFSIPFLLPLLYILSCPFFLFSIIIYETLFLVLTCLRCTFYRPNNGTSCVLVRVRYSGPFRVLL